MPNVIVPNAPSPSKNARKPLAKWFFAPTISDPEVVGADGLSARGPSTFRIFRGAPRVLGAVSNRPRAMLELCSCSRCADAADHGMHAASVENSSVHTDTPYLINLVLPR